MFVKYAEIVFGSSELALRLPNLILFIVYMIYGNFMFRDSHPIVRVGIFILLCTSNALIDLFGLARGYGMSLGFMVLSLYHFNESFLRHRKRNLILFHSGAALAILSNFTLLSFYISLLIVYNLIGYLEIKYVWHKSYRIFNANKVHIVPFLMVAAHIFELVYNVVRHNHFDFGGKGSTGYTDNIRRLAIINFLLITLSFMLIIQHHLMHTDYPIGRFAEFIYPLFIIQTGFLMNGCLNFGLLHIKGSA